MQQLSIRHIPKYPGLVLVQQASSENGLVMVGLQDGFESNEGVIVMAATNLAETLDPALKRPGRFDRQVAVPLPDIKGRQDILEYYLHDKPVSPDVDRDLLARQTQGRLLEAGWWAVQWCALFLDNKVV